MGRRGLVLVAAVLLAATCTRTPVPQSSPATPVEYPRGGILRIVTLRDAPGIYDPQRAYMPEPGELFRCCLLRTLYSYNGQPTSEGGAVARPDLASGTPTVSSDGLAWTFHLKPGLHYAPPFEGSEIVAQDIVRAIEREARIPDQVRTVEPTKANSEGAQTGGYAWYFSIIEGYDEYRAGRTDSISGLQTPEDHTLLVQLTEPIGDLPYILAMTATAPIPEGAADGHLDYGRFLVASGPYTIEGSQLLDFSVAPGRQDPVSGYVPSTFHSVGYQTADVRKPGSITLVRNPSWDPATDDLRGAYVDRIEVEVVKTTKEALALVDQGRADAVMYTPFENQLPLDLDPFLQDPEAADRLLLKEGNGASWFVMNVARPPFDDLHVRKAVLLALDREALTRMLAAGQDWSATVARHIAPDSMENGLLAGYDPYPAHSGDLPAARQQMAASRYDANGDGRCDDPVCKSVPVGAFSALGPGRDFGESELLGKVLRSLGIQSRVEFIDKPGEFYAAERAGRLAIGSSVLDGWYADYPSGANFFTIFASDADLGGTTFLGAGAQRLIEAGLPVVDVPSVDDQIDRCRSLLGEAQIRCWSELDQFMMERVLPLIPIAVTMDGTPLSERVVHASLDQSQLMPALDQFALALGPD
jgi:peptide/nickel transport system substrate-binding protein